MLFKTNAWVKKTVNDIGYKIKAHNQYGKDKNECLYNGDIVDLHREN